MSEETEVVEFLAGILIGRLRGRGKKDTLIDIELLRDELWRLSTTDTFWEILLKYDGKRDIPLKLFKQDVAATVKAFSKRTISSAELDLLNGLPEMASAAQENISNSNGEA